LHAVWDSVIYEFTGYPTLPFSTSAWNTLGNNVDSMTVKYDVPSSEYYQANVEQWAAESLDLSESTVYPGVVVNQPLSDAYLAKAAPAAEQRIVYGGRRLAEQIKYIYGSNSVFVQ
jgi:hypothetical protein